MNETKGPLLSRASGMWGIGAVVVGVIAGAVYFGGRDQPAPDADALDSVILQTAPPDGTAEPEPTAPEQAEVATAVPEASLQNQPTALPPPDPLAPQFDEVRQEADGLTVIAGRAAPGSKVTVLVDGVETATAMTDGRGSFAAVGFVTPGLNGSVVTLRQDVDNQSTASRDEIILAPLPEIPETAQAGSNSPTVSGDSTQLAATDVTEPQDQPEPVAEAPPVRAAPEEAPARQRVAVLKSTEDGVELLQTPPVVETVELDTIGYSAEGEVQLSGRAKPGATEVRVYLSNRLVSQLPVDDLGRWRGDVPDVSSGIYTLRVDEIDADGSVTSRMETPFKREDAALLAQVTAGANGPLQAITVQQGDTLWAIARDRYGEGPLYVRVFEANRAAIRDPDLIYPGQVFDLPE